MNDRDALLRLLDANLNRAAEGLRTLEDFYRFLRDDPAGASAAKADRHAIGDLRRALDAAAGPGGLAARRDTPGDVGRSLKTDAEAVRADPPAVARAAAGRAAEALRVVGEYAKLLASPAAAAAEALRYRVYEHGPRLAVDAARADRPGRLARARVWRDLPPDPSAWPARLAAAPRPDGWFARVDGMADGALLAALRAVRRAVDERAAAEGGVPPLLMLANRADLAARADWDGVRLDPDALAPADARALAGPDRLVLPAGTAGTAEPGTE